MNPMLNPFLISIFWEAMQVNFDFAKNWELVKGPDAIPSKNLDTLFARSLVHSWWW